MSKEFSAAMNDLLHQKEKISLLQEQLKDSVKGVAERFDTKPARINKILALVIKEREKSGALEELHEVLEQVEQVLL